ncbi:MAG: GNAT family N-acetyltransferase [Acidobacteria bacterium]|nr:GNAT family N-acetyltransferase [Acidobacteriota bacterium]
MARLPDLPEESRLTSLALDTPRLHLRPFQLDDAAFVLRLLNEPSFIENIGDKGVRTLDDARRYLTTGPMASYAAHGHGLLAVERTSDGAPIGMCGLLKRDTLEHPDLGYAFFPEAWGQGYALEAARAVLQNAKRDRVLAIVSPGNAASIRLLEKLGFTFEGLKGLYPDEPEVAVYAKEKRMEQG